MDHTEDPSLEQSVNEWVEEKLASLRAPAEWQPNADVGRALLIGRQRPGFFRTHTTLLATAALIAVCGLLAFPQSRVLAERCLDACVAQTNGLARFAGIKATAGALPSERTPAPMFNLPDADGRPANLADLHGKVVLVNFWATWCDPCKAEIPWFIEFEERFRDRSFTVVGISMDEDGWRSVRPYLQQWGVNYPLVLGTQELAKAYGGVEALPSTFLIDKAGKIAFTHSGLVSKATYEGEIMRLIAEKEIDK